MAEINEIIEQECVDGPFYLERVSIPGYAEDDYQYEEVLPNEERNLAEGEEDFEAALTAMREAARETGSAIQTGCSGSAKQNSISHIPEVVDDFLRNFLVKMGMSRTLASFQTDWYEIIQKGKLKHLEVEFVPDAYTHNQLLHNELKNVLSERDRYKQAVFKSGETLLTIQKERDFHRLQHRRVAQEKNRLIEDMKRLKLHCASYEPELKQLNEKYQATLKQKMLVSLERDRAFGQAQSLEVTLRNAHSSSTILSARTDSDLTQRDEKLQSNPKKNIKLQSNSSDNDPLKNISGSKHPNDSEFPLISHVNPYLAQIKSLATQGTKSIGSLCLASSMKAHPLPISCLALHPRKFIVASASDDHLWRLWGVPVEDKAWEMIMTGEGHTDWISGISFHPNGGSLATTSGDTTVRIWDFSQGRCILTLEGHSHATWGCSFHSCGDFVASCSMDNTAKVWDLHSERCRYTLRGHADSVNSVTFLPYSNTLLTCSADKTLSLWDARVSQCAQTFYGHQHSCNHAAFSPLGDNVASCDSFGVIKLWDIRKISAMVTMDTGPHSSNQVAFSPSGRMLAVASDDSTVKLLELASSQVSHLSGHTDTVQSVIFDHKGQYLLSAGSDGAILAWS